MATQVCQSTEVENVASTVTLKGSATMIREFLYYAVNSILYQRQVMSENNFTRKNKYGMSLLVVQDDEFRKCSNEVFPQLEQWMMEKKLRQVVLPIYNARSGEVIERWQFHIDLHHDELTKGDVVEGSRKKAIREIRNEMASVLQQISASSSILPTLYDDVKFKIVTYCNKDVEDVDGWADSDPMCVKNGQVLKFKNVDTTVHKLSTDVMFKVKEFEWE